MGQSGQGIRHTCRLSFIYDRSALQEQLLQVFPHAPVIFLADFSLGITPVENLTGVFFSIMRPVSTTHRPDRASEKKQYEHNEKDQGKYPHPMKSIPGAIPPHKSPPSANSISGDRRFTYQEAQIAIRTYRMLLAFTGVYLIQVNLRHYVPICPWNRGYLNLTFFVRCVLWVFLMNQINWQLP